MRWMLAPVVVGALAALAATGQAGDAVLAVAFMAVAVLSLPCMLVWLVRGGRRREPVIRADTERPRAPSAPRTSAGA